MAKIKIDILEMLGYIEEKEKNILPLHIIY